MRLEQQQDGTAKLYFITLGVLAPYRGCGIGGCMAKFVAPLPKVQTFRVCLLRCKYLACPMVHDLYSSWQSLNSGRLHAEYHAPQHMADEEYHHVLIVQDFAYYLLILEFSNLLRWINVRSAAGFQLLQQTLEAAQVDPNIVEAYLHVQTSNEEAIRFYQRAGFELAETLLGYYRKNRLRPPDAYILRKRLVN